MVLLKWFTLTLALFCLVVLIRTTYGVRCHLCQRNEAHHQSDWGDCEKLHPHDPKATNCMRKEQYFGKYKYIKLTTATSNKELPTNLKPVCEKFHNPTFAICICFTDGCNSKSLAELSGQVNGNKENGNGGARVGVDRTIIFGMTLVSAILLKK